MADYYTPGTPATPNTLARAENIAAELVTIAAAFNKIPEQLSLEQGRAVYALDTGAADAYVVALPATLAAYTTGLNIIMKAVNVNTGASTINVDGLGVKSIKRFNGDALSAGDIPAGGMIGLHYDGTNFQIAMGTLSVLSTVAIADGGTGATTAGAARTNLGSGTVGDAIFQDTTAAAVRTEIGSTTVGDAIFIAASEAAARAAISLGTAALLNTGALGASVIAAATAYPAGDGVLITDVVAASVAYADVTGVPSLGSMVLLASYSPSAAASVDITSVLVAPYKTFIIKCRNLLPATNDVALWLRTSTDNGSSFDVAGYHYTTQAKDTTPTDRSTEATAASAINLTATTTNGGVGNAATEGISCTIELIDPLGTTFRKAAEFKGHYITPLGIFTTFNGMGVRAATADVDAVQILFESGNIVSGEVRVYGLRDS